jgi:3-oxoacyl-[acyl-carrier protein] reductase
MHGIIGPSSRHPYPIQDRYIRNEALSTRGRELEGKVALVTGSARNIGRTTAEELARAGASVVIHALNSGDLCEEVVQGIRAEGGKAISALGDVRDPGQVNAVVEKAISAFGSVDILVHNAASRGNVSIEDLDFETYFKPIDISINGFFHLAKAVLPSMKAQGAGAIVGVGGMSSTKGAPGRAHVSAAKMGQAAFVRGLAHDLGPYQIRANLVVVGAFDTDRSGPSVAAVSPVAGVKIPLGRKGVPQDLANLVRFVVGPNASYITGETLHCNGGALMNL